MLSTHTKTSLTLATYTKNLADAKTSWTHATHHKISSHTIFGSPMPPKNPQQPRYLRHAWYLVDKCRIIIIFGEIVSHEEVSSNFAKYFLQLPFFKWTKDGAFIITQEKSHATIIKYLEKIRVCISWTLYLAVNLMNCKELYHTFGSMSNKEIYFFLLNSEHQMSIFVFRLLQNGILIQYQSFQWLISTMLK